jgi:hypothetical protein
VPTCRRQVDKATRPSGVVADRFDGQARGKKRAQTGSGTAWSGGHRRPRSAWYRTCPSAARKQHGPCKARWQRDSVAERAKPARAAGGGVCSSRGGFCLERRGRGWLAQDVVARWYGARGTRRRRRGPFQENTGWWFLAGSLGSHRPRSGRDGLVRMQ